MLTKHSYSKLKHVSVISLKMPTKSEISRGRMYQSENNVNQLHLAAECTPLCNQYVGGVNIVLLFVVAVVVVVI